MVELSGPRPLCRVEDTKLFIWSLGTRAIWLEKEQQLLFTSKLFFLSDTHHCTCKCVQFMAIYNPDLPAGFFVFLVCSYPSYKRPDTFPSEQSCVLNRQSGLIRLMKMNVRHDAVPLDQTSAQSSRSTDHSDSGAVPPVFSPSKIHPFRL